MKKHHADILIPEQDVRSRIAELCEENTKFYQQKNMFLTLYAHTWAKYETIGSSEICSDEDAIFGVKR